MFQKHIKYLNTLQPECPTKGHSVYRIGLHRVRNTLMDTEWVSSTWHQIHGFMALLLLHHTIYY